MAVIDELVTLIRFDMPSDATSALKKAEGGISTLTSRIKDLGIVAVATGAVTAALSVNAATEATKLSKLSGATGLSTERLQTLAAVYKEVGGSAESAGRDAAMFMQRVGKPLDENTIEELSRFIKGLDDARAIMKLQSMGFSEDIFRYLKMDRAARAKRMEYNRLNNTLTDGEIVNLSLLDSRMGQFTTKLDIVSKKIQDAFSFELGGALDDITTWLNDNQDAIVRGADTIAGGFKRAWESMKDFGGKTADTLKPWLEALDEFVKKHGGWEEAIAGVALAFAGLSAIAIPASLIGGVTALAGAMTGLGGAATGVAAVLGEGGLFIAGIAAAKIAIDEFQQGAHDRIAEVRKDIDSIKTFEDARKAQDENMAASTLAAIPIIGSPTISGTVNAITNGMDRNDEIDAQKDKIVSRIPLLDKHHLADAEDTDPELKRELQRNGYGNRVRGLSQEQIERLLWIDDKLTPKKGSFREDVSITDSLTRERAKIFEDRDRAESLTRHQNDMVSQIMPAYPAALQLPDEWGKLLRGDRAESLAERRGSVVSSVMPTYGISRQPADEWVKLLRESRMASAPPSREANRISPAGNPVTISQENNFYGVRGAEQAIPAMGEAARAGAMSGAQIAYKQAVPDDFIGCIDMADTTAGVLRIGNVAVDVRIRESHNLSMKLTQYAVESGNSISDHIIAAPNEVEIEFEMTNMPTGSGGEQPGDRARRAFQDFVAMLLARKPVQIVTEHATYKDMVFVGFSPEHAAPNLGTLRGTAKFQQAGIIGRENTVSGRDETSLSGYPSRRNAVGAGRQRMDMRTNRDTTYRTGCAFIDSGIQSIRDDQSKNDKIARKLTLYAGGIF